MYRTHAIVRPKAFAALAIALIMVGGMFNVRASAVDHRTAHQVHVGGVSLVYRSVGYGPPIVLLQGSGAAMDVWDPFMIASLAKHHRVIVFDYRGVGGSTDDVGAPMTIDVLAEDTFGLMRALCIPRWDVLGWSMGGFVAQRLAQLHPDNVRKLVLISTDPGGAHAVLPSPAIRELDTRVTLGEASIEEVFSLLFPANRVAAGEAWLERYLTQPDCCESVTRRTALRQLEAIDTWWSGPGAWEGLGAVATPTLVLHGTQDIDVAVANGRAIAARIPEARFIPFLHAGHGLPLQRPRLVAALVSRFLRCPAVRRGAS